MPIEALRTPDERFRDLPGWPYPPRWLEDLHGYEGLRLHYVDEGPREGPTALFLHGEPTWGYLYRKMIPPFLEAGHRVVAPDFFGFGRSDKPVDEAVYGFDFHRGALLAFVQRLDLSRLTLVVQDWGGILGLTLPMELPVRVENLLVMNTALPSDDLPVTEGFLKWRDFVARTPDLQAGRLLRHLVPHLTKAEAAAYDAPFPDRRYLAGVHVFPAIVPIERGMQGADTCRRARAFLASEWKGRCLGAIGMTDDVLGPEVMRPLLAGIRGCPRPLEIDAGGHFLPEWGGPIAKAALEAFAR